MDESQRPINREDEARRAYFFCREIETRCELAVIDGLQYLLAPLEPDEPAPNINWGRAHKLLSCSLIYCSAIECGGVSMPEWLVDFFFAALRLADEADDKPLGKQMLERLGSLEKPELLTKVGAEIAAMVPGLDAEAVSEMVMEYGMESTDDRLALLQTSLTLPIEHLGDLLRMLDMTKPE